MSPTPSKYKNEGQRNKPNPWPAATFLASARNVASEKKHNKPWPSATRFASLSEWPQKIKDPNRLARPAPLAIRGSFRLPRARVRPAPMRLGLTRACFATLGPCSSLKTHLSSEPDRLRVESLVACSGLSPNPCRFALLPEGAPRCFARPCLSGGVAPGRLASPILNLARHSCSAGVFYHRGPGVLYFVLAFGR